MLAAHPYGVGVGCCLLNRADGGAGEPEKVRRLNGPASCDDVDQAEKIVVVISLTEAA